MSQHHTDPDGLAYLRHEMNTPLTVIKGTAQLAARDLGRFPGLSDAERVRLQRHLSTICAAAETLAGQIEGLR